MLPLAPKSAYEVCVSKKKKPFEPPATPSFRHIPLAGSLYSDSILQRLPPTFQVCLHLLQGNMKQHMLTHKIRDLPPHLFEKKSPGSVSVPSSLVDETSNASSESREPLAAAAAASLHGLSALENLTSAAAVAAASTLSKSATVPNLGSLAISISEPSPVVVPPPRKRSPDTNAISQPVPKRQPSKHL